MIIISASRNPQNNLQCVFSEYHSKESFKNIFNFSTLQKYKAVLACHEIGAYNKFDMHVQVLQVYVQIAYI